MIFDIYHNVGGEYGSCCCGEVRVKPTGAWELKLEMEQVPDAGPCCCLL